MHIIYKRSNTATRVVVFVKARVQLQTGQNEREINEGAHTERQTAAAETTTDIKTHTRSRIDRQARQDTKQTKQTKRASFVI